MAKALLHAALCFFTDYSISDSSVRLTPTSLSRPGMRVIRVPQVMLAPSVLFSGVVGKHVGKMRSTDSSEVPQDRAG